MNENIKDAIQVLENAYKRYFGILKSLSPSSKEYDKYLVYCYQLDCVIKDLKKFFKDDIRNN